MSEDRKLACPCCGGETVETSMHGFLPHAWRDCVRGCRARKRYPWANEWWSGYDRNRTSDAHELCRDLPGPCGTRPEGLQQPSGMAPREEGSQHEELAATAKTGDASASRSVAPCDTCAAEEPGGCANDDGYCVRDCECHGPRCPRCNGACPPDATGEPWCAECGAQTRYLRAAEPERDPHAAMLARYALVLRMATEPIKRNGTQGLRFREDAASPSRSRIARIPCIHVRRGRGMTPCVCERAERSGR